MADVIKNQDAQVMLLTVFMIVVGVVTYTTVLNNMILSSNVPVTGLENSKQEIRDLRFLTEAEVKKAINDANISNMSKEEYFINHINSYINATNKLYASKGISVEIIINNVSFNKTETRATFKRNYVELVNHSFKKGSLIIPMDENQTSVQNQSQLMKVYGFIFKILDDHGTEPLNQTQIPVWTLLQNPVNSSAQNFSISIYTNDNASDISTGTNQSRDYSGGPFIIDNDSASIEHFFNDTVKTWILEEANKKNITVHELQEDIYYDRSARMVIPPKVAIYNQSPDAIMEKYYLDGEVPYTGLSSNDIQNGSLMNYDILIILDRMMNTSSEQDTVIKIVEWVVNGGILHVQGKGTDTMDDAVEMYAGSGKSWYGFIGINRSELNTTKINLNMTYIKFIDYSTTFNATRTFNDSPPLSLTGLADPGSPFNPGSQNSNKSGIIGNITENTTTPAFSFRSNGSQVNPDANILGIAAYADGTPVYIDADINPDMIEDPQLMYVEAKYGNGLVSYLAGHNQSARSEGERIIFDTFFASSMRTQLYSVITEKSVNITIKYSDGDLRYSNTFLVDT